MIIEEQPHKKWIRDSQLTIESSLRSVAFIREHRLWEGFKSYTWLIKALIGVGVIFGLYFFDSLDNLFSSNDGDTAPVSMMSYFQNISYESMTSYLDGGVKYLILIAIEIIIFHFTRRTMMVVTGEEIDTSFQTFIKAEKRMIRVAFYSFVMETILRFGSDLGLSILGLTMFELPVSILIQSFYLGFAIVDNYNELFDMTIKQSHRFTIHYAPVALISGLALFVLIKIPIIGVIAGPVLCAVVVTLAMHQITKSDPSMAWVFVEKKKKKKRSKR